MLLVIGVLITGVWGASRWWIFGYRSGPWSFVVSHATGFFATSAPTTHPFVAHRAAGWWAQHHDDFPALRRPYWYIDANEIGESEATIVLGMMAYFERSPAQGLHSRCFLVVLWPFALASLLGGGWLVWSGRRAGRRAMAGLCLKCGYDLAGLAVGAPCPECGGGGRKGAAVAAPAR